MQRLKSAFRTAFRSTVSDPRIRDHEEVKRNLVRDVVSHTSTRNVSLQRGRYLTQEESSKRFEEAKDYISHEEQPGEIAPGRKVRLFIDR